MMSFGLMRETITLLSPRRATDPAGFATARLVEVGRVRAFVEQRRATSAWVNRASYTSATTLFRFRTIPYLSVDERMFIRHAGRVYAIDGVEVLRGRYVEVLAHATAPEGHKQNNNAIGQEGGRGQGAD